MPGNLSRRKFIRAGITAVSGMIVCHFYMNPSTGEARASGTLSELATEVTMPHVIVKLWPGKSEQQKIDLAEAIVKDVTEILGSGENSISVAIEEIDAGDWKEKVYKPDILNKQGTLYKKPGYSM